MNLEMKIWRIINDNIFEEVGHEKYARGKNDERLDSWLNPKNFHQ